MPECQRKEDTSNLALALIFLIFATWSNSGPLVWKCFYYMNQNVPFGPLALIFQLVWSAGQKPVWQLLAPMLRVVGWVSLKTCVTENIDKIEFKPQTHLSWHLLQIVFCTYVAFASFILHLKKIIVFYIFRLHLTSSLHAFHCFPFYLSVISNKMHACVCVIYMFTVWYFL